MQMCVHQHERGRWEIVYLFLFDFTKKVKNLSAPTSCKAPQNQDYDQIPWLTWSRSHISLLCWLRFLLKISGCLHWVLGGGKGWKNNNILAFHFRGKFRKNLALLIQWYATSHSLPVRGREEKKGRGKQEMEWDRKQKQKQRCSIGRQKERKDDTGECAQDASSYIC